MTKNGGFELIRFFKKNAIALRRFLFFLFFKISKNKYISVNDNPGVVVSLTTYPPRIGEVWAVIETIFRQSVQPDKIVLVLCRSEFEEGKIPRSILAQVDRGLEILWVNDNIKSYKKLIPVIKKYPNSTIITFDDDVFYESWRVERLLKAAKKYKNSVVGYRGWEVKASKGEIKPYKEWDKATINTDPHRTLLTGVGGILYPPGFLSSFLLDMSKAFELAPTADDIWFWASSRYINMPVVCLGVTTHRKVKYDFDNDALYTINKYGGGNDRQIKAVLECFDLLNDSQI